jgi:hypothetical protein
LMSAFVCTQEDFFLFDPRAPYATSPAPRLHFAST